MFGTVTGTPCGLQLRGAHPERAALFYAAVLGWTPEATAAATGPALPGVAGACWLTYLAVTRLEPALREVAGAGGKVLSPPAGGRAVVRDAAGAPLGIWEIGAEPVGAPGAVFFHEMGAHDGVAARAFYAGVFGFAMQDEAPDGFAHTELKLDGRTTAALYVIGPDLPAGFPPHWMPYVSVPDADRAAARARELGGDTLRAPMDTPFGRMSTVRDPQGAAFSLISPPG